PGWWEGGSMLFCMVNLDKWNALPKHYQAILAQAAATANTWCLAKYDLVNPAALRRLLAGGTKLHGFSPAIMEACYKAAMELHDEISKENAGFKKVYDSMNAFMKDGYAWSQVAELGYDSFMVRHNR
ncbi:MAG: ABC transporter substrate-binding protein, partial [Pseudolabrys sp.]|nr:ABC transporter substrate-binding protein [Pseudolabrys sp.]